MKPRTLEAVSLSQTGFSKYGDVIAVDPDTPSLLINHGHTMRFDDLGKIDVSQQDGFPKISIFRTKTMLQPIVIKIMERHPLSSQTFFPLSNDPYLVVVAEAGELNPSKIRAFIAEPSQGVNYHPGTWHHYSLALNQESDFLVIDRGGPGENTDEITLEEKDHIEISLHVD